MKILIIDDDNFISNALKIILEASGLEVVGIGNDGSEALSLYEKTRPDILLMDIRMANVNGLEASKEILARYKDAKILLLTTFSDDEYVIKALKIGVSGYLIKQDYETIIPALETVMKGQTVFGTEVASKIPKLLTSESKENFYEYHLNEKDLEILSLIAEGLNNKEIAEKLFLSEGTVRNYISTLLEKLQLRDRTQLAIFYLKNN